MERDSARGYLEEGGSRRPNRIAVLGARMEVCPYCRVTLSRRPKRRAVCPSCGRPILVRKGRLCTDEEARAIDWCSRLQIDEAEFQRTRQKLSAEFGRLATCADTMWRLMHRLLETASSWHERKVIYSQMARFQWGENRDCLELQRQVARMQLAEWKAAADKGLLDLKRVRVEVITAGTASCPECRQLDGRRFTHEEAVSAMPLPVAACTHEKSGGRVRGWCRCQYGLALT